VNVVTTYWFKPKRYGYGATPVTWQGWVLVLGTAAIMVAVSVYLRRAEPHSWGLAAMFGFDVIALIALAILCRRKTDGEWRWRWGNR